MQGKTSTAPGLRRTAVKSLDRRKTEAASSHQRPAPLFIWTIMGCRTGSITTQKSMMLLPKQNPATSDGAGLSCQHSPKSKKTQSEAARHHLEYS